MQYHNNYTMSLFYHICIACNSTLNTYLFFYYKMQVVFKDFWKRSDSARGGIFTLKMLIKCLAMPIVVLLYSQPKISNSIHSKSHQNPLKIFAIPLRTNFKKSLTKHQIPFLQISSLKLIKDPKFKQSNPQKSK